MDSSELELPTLQSKMDLIKLDSLQTMNKGEKIGNNSNHIILVYIWKSEIGIVAENWGVKGSGNATYRCLWLVDKNGQSRVTLWNQRAVEFGEDSKFPWRFERQTWTSMMAKSALRPLITL